MEGNTSSQAIKVALWLVILTALSLGSFIVFFFVTVSFLNPVPRFLFSLLINIALSYWIIRLVKITGPSRIFLTLAPPLASVLFFVGLGIMQQSNLHCANSNNCFYIMGSPICSDWLYNLVQVLCFFSK